MYFGALIDSTCLKWSMKKCGGRGACRIYESNMYRYAMSYTCGPSRVVMAVLLPVIFAFCQCCSSIFRIIFLGLATSLSGCSYFFLIAVIIILRREARKTETEHAETTKEIELQAPSKPPEGQPTLTAPELTGPEEGK